MTQLAPLLVNKYLMQESNENKLPLEDDPIDEIPVVDLTKWIELHPKPSDKE